MLTLKGDLDNRYWIGLSTDEPKPSLTSEDPYLRAVTNGMPLYEMDSGKIYLFDENNNAWMLQNSSSSGGGSSEVVSANDITYDNSIDYEDGTIGKAIQDLEINPPASDPLSSEEALAYFKDNRIFARAIGSLNVEYVNSHFTDNIPNLDKYLTIPVRIPVKMPGTPTEDPKNYSTLYFKGNLDMVSSNSADVVIHVGKYVCFIGVSIEEDSEVGFLRVVVGEEVWSEIDF